MGNCAIALPAYPASQPGTQTYKKLPGCGQGSMRPVFILLAEQPGGCSTNQLPMYAENALAIINKENKESFVKVRNGY